MSDRTPVSGQDGFSLRRVLVGTPIPPARIVAASAGFLARGGILVLSIPIWVLPTPVGVTLLIPSDAVGASGLSPGFVQLVVVAAVCLAAVASLAAVAAAIVEIETYAWLTGAGAAPAAATGGPAVPAPPHRLSRQVIVGRLLLVEAIATVPAALAAWLAIERLVEVGRQEYLLPSSLDTAYAVRVLNGARVEVVVVVACLLVADLVHAVLARIVLERALARRPAVPDDRGSPDEPSTDGESPGLVTRRSRGRSQARRVVAVLGAWLAGWAVTIACVVPGIGVLLLGWGSVRAAYLDPASVADAGGAALLLIPTILLVSAWFLAAILAGIASLVRSVLWTAAMRA